GTSTRPARCCRRGPARPAPATAESQSLFGWCWSFLAPVRQLLLKALQVVIPEPLVVREPIPHGAKSFGDEPVAALAAVPLLGHQTGVEQDAEVLGDSRAAHLEVSRNVADGALGFGEEVEHPASRRVADRCKHVWLAVRGHHHAAIIRKR